jgi:hypothetical protein
MRHEKANTKDDAHRYVNSGCHRTHTRKEFKRRSQSQYLKNTYLMNINPKNNLDNPVKYIVSDYCKKYPDDQGNQRIHAEDKWANLAEQGKWSSNICEARAPTYGTCAESWASGPSYQPCQEWDKDLYMPLELRGYIIYSQTVGKKMEKPHHTVRAGLVTYNKAHTDTMRFNREAITLQISQDLKKENPYLVDDEDHPMGPHQKTDAIRDLIKDFFQEYDELPNQKRI